jgi:hypothetical protein
MSIHDDGRAAAAVLIRKQQYLPRDLVQDAFANGVRSRLDTTTKMIKRVHARGPTSPDDDVEVAMMPLTKAERVAIRRGKKRGPKKTQVSMKGVSAIRDIHAQGAQKLDGDFLSKVQPVSAHDDMTPLQKRASMQHAPAGTRWENVRGTWLQVSHDGQGRSRVVGGLAKGLKLPPNSSNGSNETDIADVGSTNNWDDENTENPTPEMVGGFDDTNVSPRGPRIAAAVSSVPSEASAQAIKQCLLPENKRRMMP